MSPLPCCFREFCPSTQPPACHPPNTTTELALLALHNVARLKCPQLIFRRVTEYAERSIRQLLSFYRTPTLRPFFQQLNINCHGTPRFPSAPSIPLCFAAAITRDLSRLAVDVGDPHHSPSINNLSSL